jgi:hypothetical protein
MIMAAEKEKLKIALTRAFDQFISALSDFDENVLNQIPFEGSWTPAQVAQHIILATDGVPDGNTSPTERPFDALLPMIRPWWEDLNQRFTSPEPLQPDNTPRSKSTLLSELHHVREKDLSILTGKDLTAICLDFELPSIGYLTRYEWLWFIEMHLKRHEAQLRRIRER